MGGGLGGAGGLGAGAPGVGAAPGTPSGPGSSSAPAQPGAPSAPAVPGVSGAGAGVGPPGLPPPVPTTAASTSSTAPATTMSPPPKSGEEEEGDEAGEERHRPRRHRVKESGLRRKDVQAALLRYSRERYGCCCLRADVLSVEPGSGGGPCVPFPPEMNEAGQTPPPSWPYMSAADATVWCTDETRVVVTPPPSSDDTAITTFHEIPETTFAEPTTTGGDGDDDAANPDDGGEDAFLQVGSHMFLRRGSSSLYPGQRDAAAAAAAALSSNLSLASATACKFYPGLGGPPRGRHRMGDCSNDCYTLKTPQQVYADTLKGVAVIMHREAEDL